MRPIISRLACNCVPKLMKYTGTNGMGQKVYSTRIGKPCHVSSKLIKQKKDEKEYLIRQYTFHTTSQGWSVGDVLIIQDGRRVVIDSIEGDRVLEVIAYGENTHEVNME